MKQTGRSILRLMKPVPTTQASSGSKRKSEADVEELSPVDEQPAAARRKTSPKRGRKKVVAALAEAVKQEVLLF